MRRGPGRTRTALRSAARDLSPVPPRRRRAVPEPGTAAAAIPPPRAATRSAALRPAAPRRDYFRRSSPPRPAVRSPSRGRALRSRRRLRRAAARHLAAPLAAPGRGGFRRPGGTTFSAEGSRRRAASPNDVTKRRPGPERRRRAGWRPSRDAGRKWQRRASAPHRSPPSRRSRAARLLALGRPPIVQRCAEDVSLRRSFLRSKRPSAVGPGSDPTSVAEPWGAQLSPLQSPAAAAGSAVSPRARPCPAQPWAGDRIRSWPWRLTGGGAVCQLQDRQRGASPGTASARTRPARIPMAGVGCAACGGSACCATCGAPGPG